MILLPFMYVNYPSEVPKEVDMDDLWELKDFVVFVTLRFLFILRCR